MSPPGAGAFLALWNGISRAALQPEYETWHSFEHVPERTGLPGFIEARRYRAVDRPAGTPAYYFSCYWLDSCAALHSPAYREVVTHPTPWSARMRGELRDFYRQPCVLQGGWGCSSASQLVTLRLRPRSAACAEVLAQALRRQVEAAALVCAHWGSAQPTDDFPLANTPAVRQPAAPASAGTAPTAAPELVLMLQHLDLPTLRASTRQLLEQLAPDAERVAGPDFFEFLTAVRQDQLGTPAGARPPPLSALMQRFIPGDTA